LHDRSSPLGIGLALAEKYAETGTHVVAVGRRQKQLDELASKHKGKISTEVLDIAQLDKIPAFVEKVIADHPDIECVFLNR
jgi:short-subunit dehydrogenase involved in D-alanine esterification of teichoic acids